MRTIVAISIVTAALLATSCKKTEADGASSAEIQGAFLAKMGGQIVSIGEHKVEVRLFEDGRAEAMVFDGKGDVLAEKDLAKTKVIVHGTSKPTTLAYQRETARFAGEAEGDLAFAPNAAIDIELRVDDVGTKGRLDAPVLLVGPEIGGTLVVSGKHGVELAANADGSFEAIVRDAAGARLSGDANMKVALQIDGKDVPLAWEPGRGRFVGRANADAKVAGKPASIAINGAVVARLPKVAVRAQTSHGGRVITAGEYSIEIVSKGDLVTAYAFDASGAAVGKGDLDLSLRIANGGFVKLAFDPPSASYRANVQGNLDAAAMTVAVRTGTYAAVGALAPDVKANAKAKVEAKAEAKGAANAKVDIKPPTVNAQVKPPTGGAAKATAGAKAGFGIGTR